MSGPVGGMPGLSSGSTPLHGMPTAAGAKAGGHDGSVVPPVPNWFQVLNQGDGLQKESARFEEISPRDATARSFRAPGFSARESPRPPDERRDDPNTARGESLNKSDEVSYDGGYLFSPFGHIKHGFGRLRMSGCSYEGEFVKDLKHGDGTLAWDDGRQYRGQWDSGKFHGNAVMTWPDGRKYCGQYIEDRKHGDGTFSWQDGRRYQGQWVVGKRHGVGVYTNAKGLTRTGMWQMDRPLHWDVDQAQLSQSGSSLSQGESGQSTTTPWTYEPTLSKVPQPLSGRTPSKTNPGLPKVSGHPSPPLTVDSAVEVDSIAD